MSVETQTDPVIIISCDKAIQVPADLEYSRISTLHDHPYSRLLQPSPQSSTSRVPQPSPQPSTSHAPQPSPETGTSLLLSTTPVKSSPSVHPVSSTPAKPDFHGQIPPLSPMAESPPHSPFVDEESFREEDKEDLSYRPSLDEESADETILSEKAPSVVKEKKYIVFWSCLETLLQRLRCVECSSPMNTVDTTELGSCLTARVECLNGHEIIKWDSQPKSERMPLGNFLIAGAILCSGQTFERVRGMFSLINITTISSTTYEKMQKDYFIPQISAAWIEEQSKAIAEIKSREVPVRLASDGRCDSPGFSAKYCLYSHIDLQTNKILSLQLVQVSETGSSGKMEVLGYERGMDYLLQQGLNIELCTTDRHVQVRKRHKDKYAPMGIKHEFDVYHMTNTIRKKLRAMAKKPKLQKIGPWIQSVTNHLWWCAATCGRDADILVEKWTSITYHVTNRHIFPENGQNFTQCGHAPLADTEARRTKWLIPESPEHRALDSVVADKRLLKDIRQLAHFCHTGMLEVYHSMLLKYAPKRQEFDFPQMAARLQLAALDHNSNVGRAQAVVKREGPNTAAKGELRHRTRFSKATHQWVVEPIKEQKSYSFADDILHEALETRLSGNTLARIDAPHIPRNIAPVQMTSTKEEMVRQKRTRFECQ